MYKNHRISVVVPAYNEATQIGRVIDTMPELVDTIVIVDDQSRDDTVAVVERYQQEHPRVVLLRHTVNQGVGGAIATGYEWSRDNDIDIAVVMAGDAQMDPAELPQILEPVVEEGVEYVKGNRLVYREAFHLVPKVRFFGNSVLSLLTKIASGYWHVTDSQTGYTAIHRRALQRIDWGTMYKRYGQPNDLLIKLNVEGFRVRDVPVRPVYNVGEKSGIKIWKVLFTISWLLVKGFFWRLREKYVIRDFHPLVFFYSLGFFMLAASLVLLARFGLLWWESGVAPELTMMSMLFALNLSLNAIFFAMWFDMEANKHLR